MDPSVLYVRSESWAIALSMPGLVTYPAAKVGRTLTIRSSLVALIVVRKALGPIDLITVALVEALALIDLVLVAVALVWIIWPVRTQCF
jgi:hypothetical protein